MRILSTGDSVLEESVNLIGLDVYGPKGLFIGKVESISFDTDARRVGGLVLGKLSPAVAEHDITVNVPYSWVSAVGDIVILKRFPSKVFRDGHLEGL